MSSSEPRLPVVLRAREPLPNTPKWRAEYNREEDMWMCGTTPLVVLPASRTTTVTRTQESIDQPEAAEVAAGTALEITGATSTEEAVDQPETLEPVSQTEYLRTEYTATREGIDQPEALAIGTSPAFGTTITTKTLEGIDQPEGVGSDRA